MKFSRENIVELLGGDEYAAKAVDSLIRYSGKGYIPEEEIDEELMLLLDYYRLAVPKTSLYGSLSWNMRTFLGELEIPYIVRFFFRRLSKEGRASWEEVVEEYFAVIGETQPETFTKIFAEVVGASRSFMVCGEDIVDISMNYGKDGGVVIAELKGAGLISPLVGCGRFGRAKAPLYEVNRFFAELVLRAL